MQKALFIKNISELKDLNSTFSHIYFGAEFCQRLIPKVSSLKKVIEVCKKNKLGLSLVTPYVTDEGLNGLIPLFELLKSSYPETEIIINDFGVAFFLSKHFPHLLLSLGRLLIKQKKDPRLLTIMDNLPPEAAEYFSTSLGESIFDTDLKQTLNIKRVELDNPTHGIKRQHLEIPAALHYPYFYVTTSRYCLVALAFNERSFKRRVSFKCKKECLKYSFCLQHPQMPEKIYLKGNTQFIYNPTLPSNLESMGIDRVVYQKEFHRE